MKSNHSFNLGDLVKDRVTGFKGILTAETRWLNGCVRMNVQPQGINKDGKPFEAQSFDVEQLDLVKAQVAPASQPSGGPMPTMKR